jgi:thymidylate kinase
MEQRSDEYFEKVRQGFLTEAKVGRQKIKVLDALLPASIVGDLIFAEVKDLLEMKKS